MSSALRTATSAATAATLGVADPPVLASRPQPSTWGRSCPPEPVAAAAAGLWCFLPERLRTPEHELIFFLPLAAIRSGLKLAPHVWARWLFGGDPPYPLPDVPGSFTWSRAAGSRPVLELALATFTDSILLRVADIPLKVLSRHMARRLVHWAADPSISAEEIPKSLAAKLGEREFRNSAQAQWANAARALRALEPGASHSLGDFSKRENPGLPVALTEIAAWQTVASVGLSRPSDRDAILGAMGLKAYVRGTVTRRAGAESHLFEADLEIGRRIFDSFDFQGGQALGFWSLTEPSPDAATLLTRAGRRGGLIQLDNRSFQRFRDQVKEPYNALVQRAEAARAHSTPPLCCEPFDVATAIEPWPKGEAKLTLEWSRSRAAG